MLGSALLGSFYCASATAQTPGLPPPLPPAAKATRWARSGIARSNATRSNYIRPHITVLLEQHRYPNPPVTVDITVWTREGTLLVNQAINDEPDSCSLTLKPETPPELYPAVGDVVAVGLATESTVPDHTQRRIAAGLEFAGPVVVTQHDRRENNRSPWVSMQCQDWQWFFDAQLVNAVWPAQSATLTITDLLARFVNYSQITGSVPQPFTMDYVPTDLPTCGAFEAINWRASEVVRHLAGELKGGFYIDPRRIVHLWANGPEPNQSDPRDLTNYLPSLKSFRHKTDATGVRRRVATEGMRTQILVDVPLLTGVAVPYTGGIPVADARPFVSATELYARLGAQWVRVQVTHPLQAANENPFSAHVTAAFALTDVALALDLWPPFLTIGSGGWIKVGEQFLRYSASSGAGANQPCTLTVNQASFPFGRPVSTIKVGDTATWVDWVDSWQRDAHTPSAPMQPLLAAVAGTELVVLAQATDPDAAQPWALQVPPIEELVEDQRYGYVGAQTRATDDVNFFRQPALSAEWLTEDFNARPGRPQVVLLGSPDSVSAALTILTVGVTFPLRSLAPRRACTAALVKPATLLDVLTTSTE